MESVKKLNVKKSAAIIPKIVVLKTRTKKAATGTRLIATATVKQNQ